MAKSKKTGNTAAQGIQSGDAAEKKKNETYSEDPFIEKYIKARIAGATPEDATTAARKAVGMTEYPTTGKSAADRAVASGDAYLDESTGRVMLTEEGRKKVGNRSYAQAEKDGFYETARELTPAEKYAERVRKTAATVPEGTPHSGWDIRVSEPTSHGGYTDPAEAYAARIAREQEEAENQPSALERTIEFVKDFADPDTPVHRTKGTSTNWQAAGAQQQGGETAGADGAKPGLADQSGTGSTHGSKNPITGKTAVYIPGIAGEENRPESEALTQYLYPEDESGRMRFQSRTPFENWQKELIDEMNAAYNDRDFTEQERLRGIYNAGYEAYLRDRYERDLPEGATPYDSMYEALGSGNRQEYDAARNNLTSTGYSGEDLDDQTAEWIHTNAGSVKDGETMLRDYLGLSQADAEATSIYWWWIDTNGRQKADTNENNRLTQAELGEYLKPLEETGVLTEAQAAMIWNEALGTPKTTYAMWKGKQK